MFLKAHRTKSFPEMALAHADVGPFSMACFNAARAKERVESSVGKGEFWSFMISGISVHPSTTASQPSFFNRVITSWK